MQYRPGYGYTDPKLVSQLPPLDTKRVRKLVAFPTVEAAERHLLERSARRLTWLLCIDAAVMAVALLAIFYWPSIPLIAIAAVLCVGVLALCGTTLTFGLRALRHDRHS